MFPEKKEGRLVVCSIDKVEDARGLTQNSFQHLVSPDTVECVLEVHLEEEMARLDLM
jgi:hypothetical protein